MMKTCSHERVVRCDMVQTVVDWSYLPIGEHKNGLEIIVQTHLFSGFPRVINALKALEVAKSIDEDVLQDVKKVHVLEESKTFDEVCRQGRGVMEIIYGKEVAKKLEEKMYDTHPAIAYFMVDHGYGRTLARPGPTLLQREFATIAALAGQSCVPQMISHLRGCARLGATGQQLRSILV
jgi:alkylhydroperoxidase/carboxymuconolactone decarboxylase family protein YurZ